MGLNKKEESASYYDECYSNSTAYRLHYSKLPHYAMWKRAMLLVGNKKNIFEIGCGSGQFGNLATDYGKDYWGFDFSRTAIEIAESLKLSNATFKVADIRDWNEFPSFDIYVTFEVLEHIKDDRGALYRIPEGKQVLFSVPNFDYASHIRIFKNQASILGRYSDLVKINGIYKFNTATEGKWWYLCNGVRIKTIGRV